MVHEWTQGDLWEVILLVWKPPRQLVSVYTVFSVTLPVPNVLNSLHFMADLMPKLLLGIHVFLEGGIFTLSFFP